MWAISTPELCCLTAFGCYLRKSFSMLKRVISNWWGNKITFLDDYSKQIRMLWDLSHVTLGSWISWYFAWNLVAGIILFEPFFSCHCTILAQIWIVWRQEPCWWTWLRMWSTEVFSHSFVWYSECLCNKIAVWHEVQQNWGENTQHCLSFFTSSFISRYTCCYHGPGHGHSNQR